MSWEVLPAGVSKRSNEPAISVQKNFRISWNRGTQDALGNPEHVDLLLDRSGRRLGLRKCELSETSFKARKAKDQDTWGISAKGPLTAAGIAVEASHRRYAETADGIVFIDITEILQDA